MSEPVTAFVPLPNLYIHLLNTRSTPPNAEIEALADSIDQLGLLQNLSGFRDPDIDRTGNAIGIVAGGRRLRALQLLAERSGADPAGITVPVLITEDEAQARLWASAENAARQPLHPADEVRAYRRMQDSGAAPSAIAKAFAVTERHVRQRLSLGNLPAPALDALREGAITLDQAGALTVARSEEALLAELRRVLNSTWNIGASEIRRNLLSSTIQLDDRRIQWLGLDAYRTAGGTVQEDLFSDDVRILDEALLDELFARKLEECAQAERERGYAWVEISMESHVSPWSLRESHEEVFPTPIELPEADASELERLQGQDELTDEELERLEELEARAAGDIADEDRETSGIWLYVNHQGELCASGPWRALPAGGEGEDGGEDDDAPAAPKAEKLSQAVVDDMKRVQRLAVQTALLDKPELVLDLLTLSLTAPLYDWQRPLALSVSPPSIEPDKADGAVIDERLVEAVNDGKVIGARGELSPAHLEELRALGKKARNARLTAALARLYGALHRDFLGPLARLSGADIRKVWTPNAANYFDRVPVARLDAIWAELVADNAEAQAAWSGMKKASKAADLDRLFRDGDFRAALFLDADSCRRIDAWVPAEMAWPEAQEDAA